jgi:hypothetical protein
VAHATERFGLRSADDAQRLRIALGVDVEDGDLRTVTTAPLTARRLCT